MHVHVHCTKSVIVSRPVGQDVFKDDSEKVRLDTPLMDLIQHHMTHFTKHPAGWEGSEGGQRGKNGGRGIGSKLAKLFYMYNHVHMYAQMYNVCCNNEIKVDR